MLMGLVMLALLAAGCSSEPDGPPADSGDASAETDPDGGDLESTAVTFMETVLSGGDASSFVRDPAVLDQARFEDMGPEADYDVSIAEDYQGQLAEPGACGLVGDVTIVCYVLVERADVETETVVAVYLTEMPPDAEYVDGQYLDANGRPMDPVDPYVVNVEVVAG